MIHSSRQLKDLIRNLAKDKKIEAHVLIRNYMMERFLERITLSVYKDKMILKGGMLIAAMVGLGARTTMDIDATMKGASISIAETEKIIEAIIAIPVGDGVEFRVKNISEIMEDAEYGGIRVSMETVFDGIMTPLKIDISTGDVITPREIIYEFKLMFEDRKIALWAYNLETVLAEKLETVIDRNVTNTRMRDFYDIHLLLKLHGDSIEPTTFSRALDATAMKRGSLDALRDATDIFNELAESENLQKHWAAYQKKFSFAAGLEWREIMLSVCKLVEMTS